MDKIVKKFVFSFILIAMVPCLSLIFFQKYQMKNSAPLPPPMYMQMDLDLEFANPNIMPPEPPIAIPIIVLLLSCGGLCFLWTKYLKKIFINPLVEIINGLKEFDKGNFEVKFKTKSDNEYIADAFKILNLMVENTKEREKLKKYHIQNIIHDLRAPILAQDRALEILAEEFKNHELVEGLKKNTQKYIGIINLILEAYQYNLKDIKIEKKEISFNLLIEDIIKEIESLAKEKNIKIVYHKQNTDDIVFVDYFSITRIMTNLIANSIENIENGKIITIKIENKDKTHIVVEDNGKGIEQENLNTIFDRYSSNSKTKVVSGLGLNIVKNLVEKNNGKISVESQLNSYTRFTIVFDKKEDKWTE